MAFAIYETPVGKIYIEYEDNAVTYLKRVQAKITDFGVKTPFTDNIYAQLQEYFNGKRKTFDFKYKLKGTDFQQKVWQALCDIPYGETRTYKDIAIAIGNDKACRAVGMANNKNPISIAVPCHRVIGASGKLVGYASGLDMKEHLLKLESENINL